MNKHQQGATLIIVLMLLVGIIIIGTFAIRQSITSLRVATNSQAQQLFLQNADAGFFNAERQESLVQSFAANGMFGYINGAQNKDKELVFCFRGDQTRFFDLTKASLIYWAAGQQAPTNNQLGTDGYCNATATTGNFFTSGRKVVMTQVAVKFSHSEEGDPFYGTKQGTDNKVVKFEDAKPLKIFTTSISPNMTSANKADINNCLSNHMHEVTVPEGTTVSTANAANKRTVAECLEDLNVPFSAYVTEYVLAQDFE